MAQKSKLEQAKTSKSINPPNPAYPDQDSSTEHEIFINRIYDTLKASGNKVEVKTNGYFIIQVAGKTYELQCQPDNIHLVVYHSYQNMNHFIGTLNAADSRRILRSIQSEFTIF